MQGDATRIDNLVTLVFYFVDTVIDTVENTFIWKTLKFLIDLKK